MNFYDAMNIDQIDRGERGERGDRGEQGEQGERGERGEAVAYRDRKSWWWIEWSSRFFFATWPAVFGLGAAFLLWVANSLIQHDKRISELERIGPKDMETMRLQINADVSSKSEIRFGEILTEIKVLQRQFVELKVRQEMMAGRKD